MQQATHKLPPTCRAPKDSGRPAIGLSFKYLQWSSHQKQEGTKAQPTQALLWCSTWVICMGEHSTCGTWLHATNNSQIALHLQCTKGRWQDHNLIAVQVPKMGQWGGSFLFIKAQAGGAAIITRPHRSPS